MFEDKLRDTLDMNFKIGKNNKLELFEDGHMFDIPGEKWKINPKPAVRQECHESTSVASNGDATISFQ